MRPTTMLSVWCARPLCLGLWGLASCVSRLLHYCLPKRLPLDYALCFLQEGKGNYGFAGIFCKRKRTPALSALTRAKVLEEDDGGVSKGRLSWGAGFSIGIQSKFTLPSDRVVLCSRNRLSIWTAMATCHCHFASHPST